jgi:hypothetical protein
VRTLPPNGGADDHRHPVAALRAEAHPGDLALDLVEGLAAEAEELQLADRHQPAAGQPDGGADDHRLGQRHVDDAVGAEALLQPLGGPEHAAVDADVLTQQHHPLVALHLRPQAGADRLDHVHGRHQAPSPVAASRCRASRGGASA